MLLYLSSAFKARSKKIEEILMEKLGKRLTQYLISKKAIDINDYEVYKYGMITGIEYMICFAITLALSVYIDAIGEYIIFMLTFYCLRSYVGGIHFRNFGICCTMSCSIITLVLVASKFAFLSTAIYFFAIMLNLFLIAIFSSTVFRKIELEDSEKVFYQKQLKKIFIGLLILSVIFLMMNLKEFIAVLMYETFIVLISLLLDITLRIKKRR